MRHTNDAVYELSLQLGMATILLREIADVITSPFFMHFYPGTITTQVELINSDLQLGLDRHLRHTQH